MPNQLDINTFSKDTLKWEQNSTDFYNYILVFAIFLSLVATIFLIFHSNRLSNLKDLQLQQMEYYQSENNLHIANINNEVAKEKEKTARLMLDLEKQKNENLRLYELLLPRYIDIDRFANTLSKYKSSRVEIRSTNDGEASNLKEQLITAFRKAGWTVNFTTVFYKHQFNGLEITINPEMFSVEENITVVPKMETIKKELKDQNIESYIAKSNDEHQRDYIIINIGFKGNPYNSKKSL